MIYPLLPIFLAGALGANASFIGAIEGAAETTASLLKLLSGWWSDKVATRKPFVVAGYLIASIVRPFTAATRSATQVLAIRLTDRVGKGIRTSPRDALLADSAPTEARGRAYGFHAAADNAGAVLGPLVAFFILRLHGVGALDTSVHLLARDEHAIRNVFWLSAIPAAIAMLVLIMVVRDVPRRDTGAKSAETPGASTKLGRRFWGYLVVVLLFTLGNSTDAFLLLRANQLGVPVALAPILWALLNFVKAATGTYGGQLSDTLGRKPLIVGGWLLYAAVYFAFGWAGAAWEAWLLFAVYGIFYGMTEGTEKALVADIVPTIRRGAAFGWYNLAIGLGALPASLIFGWIWDRSGAPSAFAFGATLALVAALLMAFVAPASRRRGQVIS
ncbi:MAG: MFS transporter [Gemmatimonadetes bacterium]|nr:MAG: MFS transporter [Gemmatimonadota bacterium]PYP50002.1 MAG: MFS transporter [Gemmatimonadota bacterium]